MFGGSDFWLETRVIIKISKKMIPHIKPKVTQKNLVFQNRQFSIFFCENFMDWSTVWWSLSEMSPPSHSISDRSIDGPQYDGLRITIKKGTPKIISKSISTMPRECPVGYKNLICHRYHYYKISF